MFGTLAIVWYPRLRVRCYSDRVRCYSDSVLSQTQTLLEPMFSSITVSYTHKLGNMTGLTLSPADNGLISTPHCTK